MKSIINALIAKYYRPKVILCIYTCEAHKHLLEEFYCTKTMRFLTQKKRIKIIEVTADQDVDSDTLTDSKLILKLAERYDNLPRKTYSMLCYIVNNFEFDFIIKIDVTTLTTALRDKTPTGGMIITEKDIIEQLSKKSFYSDYNGFVQINAARKGVENWARKKGLKINYEQVFTSDKIPPFYSGKMWILSYSFASFISNQSEAAVENFSINFPAEDVMLGTLFQDFKRL